MANWSFINTTNPILVLYNFTIKTKRSGICLVEYTTNPPLIKSITFHFLSFSFVVVTSSYHLSYFVLPVYFPDRFIFFFFIACMYVWEKDVWCVRVWLLASPAFLDNVNVPGATSSSWDAIIDVGRATFGQAARHCIAFIPSQPPKYYTNFVTSPRTCNCLLSLLFYH